MTAYYKALCLKLRNSALFSPAGFCRVVRYLAICQEFSEYLFASRPNSASLAVTGAMLKALSSASMKLLMSTLFASSMLSDLVQGLQDSPLAAVCLVPSTC